ncbi:hypothetical protein [Paraburkholderia terrae]|uniref:hypothetical protein n=1 Tax=Paraburkholderia terrae TaxID=311230 RepID=UPI0033658841
MAAAASHYPVIGSFATLPRYEEVVGSRTRFYHNTDPVVLQSDWDVRIAKTGYTREAGRCIVVDVNMPDGQLIIALLGARSSRARSAGLVTIRRWLDGDETPVVTPRRYHASTQMLQDWIVIRLKTAKHRATCRLPCPPCAFRRDAAGHTFQGVTAGHLITRPGAGLQPPLPARVPSDVT